MMKAQSRILLFRSFSRLPARSSLTTAIATAMGFAASALGTAVTMAAAGATGAAGAMRAADTAVADNAPLLEEIVVTGEFRAAELLETPASISVVSLDDYRAGTVNHLEEILGWLPNVNFSSGGSRARFVQIRGIGERGQFAEPLNSSVGLMLDGVDMSGLGNAATLFDVAQVEVLRGPQGTLYGANGMAGLLNVRTNDPTETPESALQLDAGDYGTMGVGGVVSGPLNELVGYRLAAQLHREDGFIDNAWLDRDDTNDRDELTLRGKLAWQPVDTQDWAFSAGHVDLDNGYDAFSLDNDRKTRSDQPGRDRQRATWGSSALTWDLSPAVTFQGTAGYVVSDIDYGYDEDWTWDGFHPDGYSSTDRYLRDRETATLDLRWLSGPQGKLFGDRTAWVAGVYGLKQDEDLERRYTFADADFTSRFEVERVAAYGELEHELTQRLHLTLGLRAERHHARYHDSEAVRFSPTDTMQGGRLVLGWDYADNAMAYASVSRGYKAGGFNISGTLDADLREYDPESLWNYELGLKGRWLDNRLTARLAAFTMQRDDVQVDTSITRVREDGSAEFIDLIGNAAEGSNTGLELETDFAVSEEWLLFASLGLLDTEFQNFVNNSGENLDGRQQAQSPSYQFHAGAEYRPGGNWYVRLESEGKDSYYFSNSDRLVSERDQIRSNAYVLWHASIGYEAARWSAKLWGRNLGDEDYATRGYYFGNDPRDGYAAKGYTQLGEPRRYGLTVTLRY